MEELGPQRRVPKGQRNGAVPITIAAYAIAIGCWSPPRGVIALLRFFVTVLYAAQPLPALLMQAKDQARFPLLPPPAAADDALCPSPRCEA